MCGIAGLARRDRPIDPDPAAALGAALAHRGPDGEGIWRSRNRKALLVHRRLAIIDPGPGGAQPMATPDGRHHIVFNGEVYNYRDLRGALEARGERFSTGSDTEVLLRLLVCDGPEALARVRGMFALGWWDDGEGTLVLARDRFGIKPVYVAEHADTIAFASEIRALSAAGVPRTIDPAGVMAYLAWGSVPPPLTWCAGVESLEPGTWLRWDAAGSRSTGRFADVSAAYRRDVAAVSEGDLRERVGKAVEDSVAAHLVADVPVGVFLSGGIDSSAIVSAAASAGFSGLHTFTVRFDDRSSEHEYARLVASAFGADHRELVLDASNLAADLPMILDHLDQPTLDAVNSFYVSKAVRATGIKAVLSGTGGDELFGGYPSFRRLPSAVRWARRLGPLVPMSAPLAAVLPDRLSERWRTFASGDGRMDAAYTAQRGVFMRREVARMAGPALRDQWSSSVARLDATESALLSGAADTLEGDVARLETRLYLRSQLLRDIDVMSMAHALEVRVPFVDHELLGAVWPDLGAHPALMANKRLLHETLARPLPTAAVDRPKQGFTLPFHAWLGGELQPFVRSGMDALASAGWITPGTPDAVWQSWRSGAAHWSRPWALGVLGAFLRAA